jgi:sugar phosphate isomerase/epimerase
VSYLRSFSTLGCPDLSLDEVFALAVRHGLAGVELRALAGTLDLPDFFSRRFGTPAAARASRGAAPLPIFALDTSFKLSDQDPVTRETLLSFVPWAEALGVPRLRVFDGGHAGDATELAAATATLAWWRELRERHGWQTDLMIETHDSLFTGAVIQRLLALAPNAAVLWDTHHTWKRGGENPVTTWRAIKANVVHVHVKDSISQPSARHPLTYVKPGDGEFPAAALFAALHADAYSGPVSLEWEKLWHTYLGPLDEALAAANARAWW